MAMLVTGFMAKQAPQGSGSGGLGGLIGSLGGLGGLGAMLDMNGDGNALDDILRMAGKRNG